MGECERKGWLEGEMKGIRAVESGRREQKAAIRFSGQILFFDQSTIQPDQNQPCKLCSDQTSQILCFKFLNFQISFFLILRDGPKCLPKEGYYSHEDLTIFAAPWSFPSLKSCPLS